RFTGFGVIDTVPAWGVAVAVGEVVAVAVAVKVAVAVGVAVGLASAISTSTPLAIPLSCDWAAAARSCGPLHMGKSNELDEPQRMSMPRRAPWELPPKISFAKSSLLPTKVLLTMSLRSGSQSKIVGPAFVRPPAKTLLPSGLNLTNGGKLEVKLNLGKRR